MNSAISFGCVAIGGAIGACSRYSLTLLLSGLESRFPYATLVANLSGAFTAGVLVTWMLTRELNGSAAQLFLVVGFLGSFTTLSAFSLETLRLMQAGTWLPAVFNIMLTVGGCLMAAYLGAFVARKLVL